MKTRIRERSRPRVATGTPVLTVLLLRDNGHYMAKCPELDLVTEADKHEEAYEAILEMIREYAEDYSKRKDLFDSSPNRSHHRPYVERVNGCRSEWELRELLEVRHGHVLV